MKLAHLRSFSTSMDVKSTVSFLRQLQGIYEENPIGHFPGLLEPTLCMVLYRQIIFSMTNDFHRWRIQDANTEHYGEHLPLPANSSCGRTG